MYFLFYILDLLLFIRPIRRFCFQMIGTTECDVISRPLKYQQKFRAQQFESRPVGYAATPHLGLHKNRSVFYFFYFFLEINYKNLI